MASHDDGDGLTPPADTMTDEAAATTTLRKDNIRLQREVDALKEQLAALQLELEGRVVQGSTAQLDHNKSRENKVPATVAPMLPPRAPARHGLNRSQVERYSRHLLLPAFGVAAQERLVRGSVLVVGCGGLGSPVAMYLAAAGVGRLGLVDHDTVDVTNLHRQVMHATSRVGQPKALSGQMTCGAINPTIQIDVHTTSFSPANALSLTDMYDVVVDASDNPATRYLVSDACVVSGKPLVSAAAVGTDGQLTVYNYGEDGPCYRCLFPESPAPENCSRCGEAGVLGVVPGIMGCLQALEAIKILAGVGQVGSKKLTIFDALAGRFTTVRLRGRSPSCAACGPCPTITRASLPSYDYCLFTGQPADDGPPEDLQLLDPRVRLEPSQVAQLLSRRLRQGEQQGDHAGCRAAAPIAPGPADSAAPRAQAEVGSGPGAEIQADTVRSAVEETDDAPVGTSEIGGTQEDGLREAESTQQVPDGVGGAVGIADAVSEEQRVGSGPCRDAREAAGYGSARGDPVLLDVRPQAQYDIMALPGVVHVPFERLEQRLAEVLELCGGTAAGAIGTTTGAGAADGADVKRDESAGQGGEGRAGPCQGPTDEAPRLQAGPRVVVLCRRGNNSQRVVARLAALGMTGVTDMRGGYQAWAREVDPSMPVL